MRKIRTDVSFTNPKCRFHFVASFDKRAQSAKQELKQKYGSVSLENAQTIVVLGGDGTLLSTLRTICLNCQKF